MGFFLFFYFLPVHVEFWNGFYYCFEIPICTLALNFTFTFRLVVALEQPCHFSIFSLVVECANPDLILCYLYSFSVDIHFDPTFSHILSMNYWSIRILTLQLTESKFPD